MFTREMNTTRPPIACGTRGRRLLDAWHVWLPVLLLVALCLPRLTLQLPATTDLADEIYQPMQTLRFVARHGRGFDKYGPTLNYLLLPIYGATFGCWKLTHQVASPGETYPYGLSDPIRQLGLLVLETRLACLALSAAMVGVLSDALARVTRSRTAALLVVATFVVGDYSILWNAPLGRPDSTMLAFLGLAVAVALRTAVDGPTRGRAIALALCATAAVGAKEIAGPPLVATIVALLVYLLLEARGDGQVRRRAIRWFVVTVILGAIFYFVSNVAVSPTTWWRRVTYWIAGDGLSGDVWARSTSWGDHLTLGGRALWNNLGPAGAILMPILVPVALWTRPRLTLLTLVPVAASAAVVMTIPYTPDRFVSPVAFGLVASAAIGAAALLRSRFRPAVLAVVASATIVNLWWVTITFHLADNAEQAMLERAAAADDRSVPKAVALMFADAPSSHRLAYLGHAVDGRSMQSWLDPQRPPPAIVYADAGRMQMIDEAARMPGRAKYYESLSGFERSRWPGMTALGYREPEVISVPVPAYLRPFSFMPLFGELHMHDVLVYRRAGP